MIATARFGAVCSACGDRIAKGDLILWARDEPVMHVRCPCDHAASHARPPRPAWTNTRILGACGLSAAMLGALAGALGSVWPRIGMAVTGLANVAMLAANIVLVARKER